MGQRLNVEIMKDDKCIANAYYHWSGYSTSSIKTILPIIKFLESNEFGDTIEDAVDLLKLTGATLTKEEHDYAKKNGIISSDFMGCNGRNEGLIAVSDKEIKKTRSWEEGRISIYPEQRIIDFDVKHEIEDDDEIPDNVMELPFDSLSEIKFSEVKDLLNFIKEAEDSSSGNFKIGKDVFSSIY